MGRTAIADAEPLELFRMPPHTRTQVDARDLRIAELERENRALRALVKEAHGALKTIEDELEANEDGEILAPTLDRLETRLFNATIGWPKG